MTFFDPPLPDPPLSFGDRGKCKGVFRSVKSLFSIYMYVSISLSIWLVSV